MAKPSEDEILVGHYLKIWDSYGTPPEHYRSDAAARILSFIRSGREERRLTSFLAVVDGDIAGSASCQLHQSPFPEVIRPEQRLHGYIWSVYVADAFPAARHRIGADRQGCRLSEIDRLHDGRHPCFRCLSEPVYRAAGFELAKEMRLKFSAE